MSNTEKVIGDGITLEITETKVTTITKGVLLDDKETLESSIIKLQEKLTEINRRIDLFRK